MTWRLIVLTSLTVTPTPQAWSCQSFENIIILSPFSAQHGYSAWVYSDFLSVSPMLVIPHNSRMPSVLFFVPNGSAWNNNTL